MIHDAEIQATPADPLLHDLRMRYQCLPHPRVRYKTRQGQDFLRALHLARKSGATRTRLATLLGVTPHGIDAMLKQRQSRRKLVKWPDHNDMRHLRMAWKGVRKRVGRNDPVFEAVHIALQELLMRGFELHEIALALGEAVRDLRRFIENEPLEDAETLARKIKAFFGES